MSDCQVLVLGGGIAGSLTAIRLADAGLDVIVLDRAGEPMTAASRWNEGKIHLGYCYLGDASMNSACLMLNGAACFVDDIERLTGTAFRDEWFTQGVVYLVDPETQFPASLLWKRSFELADMLEQLAETRPGLRRWTQRGPVLLRLDPRQASRQTGLDRISDAWRTSERAVAPGPVADAIRQAVESRGIPLVRADVTAVAPVERGWMVEAGAERFHGKTVVNATWESRNLIDHQVTGMPANCSIRFKYGAFGQGLRTMTHLAPSTRIVGPFGDVTPYRNGEAYISWYPAGLAGLSDDGHPPRLPALNPAKLLASMLDGLGLGRATLEEPDASWEIKGGYIVAHGQGDIDHVNSPLHCRSRPGAFEIAPGFISVDTGKYSLGPLVSAQAAALAGQYLQRQNAR